MKKRREAEEAARRRGPKMPPMRTNDFQDEDMNGVDDRDESSRGKKRPSGTVKTGPGRGPRGPSVDMDKLKDLIKNANAGGARQPGSGWHNDRADRLLATWINLGTLLRTLTPKVARICQDFPAVVC
jgi:hypothetical protein